MIIEVSQLAGLACVFMRMTGCILFNPIFGRRNFPTLFRIAVTLALSLMIVAYSSVEVDFRDVSFIETVAVLLKELFVGFVLGTVVSLFTYVVILGGEFIDMQIGLGMSKLYDPQSGVQMSINATFLNMMFVFLFFGMNAHLTLIHLFLNSAQVVPYGQSIFAHPELSMKILDVFCQCTILGVKLTLPIAGMVFLLEMGVGILMKAIPQINVFVLNIQAKILVGIIMILVIFTPLSTFIERVITSMFETMSSILFLL